jgi:hypothetical protein
MWRNLLLFKKHTSTTNLIQSVFLSVIITLSIALPAASAAECTPYRTREGLNLSAGRYVQYLLRNSRAVYWYTQAGDADFADLEADGTLGAATIIESSGLGAPVRGALRARGIVPAASVDLPSDASEQTLFDLMSSPLENGWDAVALDEFPAGADNAAALRALGRVRISYPDAALMAWVQPGAPIAQIAPLADLLLVEITDARGDSAHLRESHARTVAQRLDDIAATLLEAGPGAPAKSLAAPCSADDFDDADPSSNAYLCDNRADVDFYLFLDTVMRDIRRHPALGHGAAIFGHHRTRPDTVRFVNSLLEHYFNQNKTGYFLGSGSWHGSVREGGFEKDGAWTFEGKGASLARYADTRLPENVRAGHGWSENPEPHAEVPHGVRALRLQGDGAGCSATAQDLRLEPGATYVFEAVLTGLRGNERASVWVYDTANGKEHFQAVLPVTGIPAGHWMPVRFAFTLPHDTGAVRITLSDCDLNEPQTIFWDHVSVNRMLNPSDQPHIIAAAPAFVKGEGYGFRIQWTPFRHKNSSFTTLQYSLDGAHWANIATLFDEAHYFDWLPEGMATLPFNAIPPGQQVLFRVKIVFWDDSETPWSEPARVVMARYEQERSPLLLSADPGAGDGPCKSASSGLFVSLISPLSPPVSYTAQFSADNGETWTGNQGIPGAADSAALPSVPAGATLMRLRANYADGKVYSNIIALPAAD